MESNSRYIFLHKNKKKIPWIIFFLLMHVLVPCEPQNWLRNEVCIACFQDEYISCTSPKFCFRGALAWCISPIAWGPLRLLSSLGQQAGPGQAGTSIIRASYGASSGLHMVAHIALDMAIYMGRYMANDLQLLWAPDSLGQNFYYRILSWTMFCLWKRIISANQKLKK